MTKQVESDKLENIIDQVVRVQHQIGRLLPKKEKKGSQALAITKPFHPKVTALLFIGAALITFLFIVLEFFIFEIPSRVLSEGELALNITLFSVFGSLFLIYILIERFPVLVNALIMIQTAILIILLAINPESSADFMVLTFPLSALAAFFLRPRNAIWWLVFYFAVGLIAVTYLYGIRESISFGTTAGAYAVFGTIGALMRRSNQAYYSMEGLYDELHDTHMQLTRYSKGVRQLAVSEERNRVAREMHDSLGHSLTVAVVQLEGAEKLIPKDPDRAAGIINDMRAQLKNALGELRATLAQLRADDPDEVVGNLSMALTELKNNFAQATSLDIQLELPDHMPELDAEQRLALYRAAQEGLTNVQRHSEATAALVSLKAQQEEMVLTVADNGKGYPAEISDGRFGIRGLEERADFFGGRLTRKNRQSGGAQLQFLMPFEVPDRE